MAASTSSPVSIPVPLRPGRSLLVRGLIGLLAVLGVAFGGAVLLHASIDPSEDAVVTAGD